MRGIEGVACRRRTPSSYARWRCRVDPATEQRRRVDEWECGARAERFSRRADSSAFL